MDLRFVPLTRAHAEEIVEWKYESPFDLYDFAGDDREAALAQFEDERSWFFAVLSASEMIAIRTFGADGQVAGGEYDDACLDTGGALRPDLTGCGLGAEIVRSGVEFGSAELGTNRFRVTVAAFNERALKVCKRVGFRERIRFRRAADDREFVVLTIEISSTTLSNL